MVHQAWGDTPEPLVMPANLGMHPMHVHPLTPLTCYCMQGIRWPIVQNVVPHTAVLEGRAVHKAWGAVEGEKACADRKRLQGCQATVHQSLQKHSSNVVLMANAVHAAPGGLLLDVTAACTCRLATCD